MFDKLHLQYEIARKIHYLEQFIDLQNVDREDLELQERILV